MRGLPPRMQTPHPSAMLRIASTLSHRGEGEERPPNGDSRSAAISAAGVPNHATMPAAKTIEVPAEGQATRENADAVQGFAEDAFRVQRRGMAGAPRSRGRASARLHARFQRG